MSRTKKYHNNYEKHKNTQKAGFLGAIKHWNNMRQFNTFVKNLQNEERKVNKVMGSYNIVAQNFKDIAEDKRNKSTEYVLNKRQHKIIEFSKPEDSNSNSNSDEYFNSLMNSHDLEMIEQKDKKLEIEINQANKSIQKKIPNFIEDKKTLEKNTKKFRDIVEQISSGDLGNFQAKVKLLRKEYDVIASQSKGTLKSTHKKALKKYSRHKADYDKVVKIDDTYIQKQQELVHKINDLLKQGQFYLDQMDVLDTKKNNIDNDIAKWEEIYTNIFELIKKILKSIKTTKKQIEEIKKNELEINIAILPIAETSTDKIIKHSSTELKNKQAELDNVIKYLDASALNINEVYNMLINEKMASELYLDTTIIATAFLGIANILQNYKNIFNPITLQKGGASISPSVRHGRRSGRGRVGFRSSISTVGSIIAPKTIHPICYLKDNDNQDFEKILANTPNKNSALFIYIDSFEDYGTGAINPSSNYTENFRQYRQDIPTKSINARALGIPVGFKDTGLQTNKTTLGFFNTSITFDTVYNNTFQHGKLASTINQINDSKTLFETALKNIYAYVKKFNNNITDIYFYSYCKNNIIQTPHQIYMNPYFKSNTFTRENDNYFNTGVKTLCTKIITDFNFNYPASPAVPPVVQPVGTPPPAGTPPPLPNIYQYYKQNVPIDSLQIKDNYLVDSTGKRINIRSPPSNTEYVDNNNTPITNFSENTKIKLQSNRIGIIQNGNIFVDPSLPENSPIRSILTTIQSTPSLSNTITLINDKMNTISKLIGDIITPNSEFSSLLANVQELSQNLIKLKYIEPKVINIELDKPKPLASKYSWILKPVELNKSEFHALKGTETLNDLIKKNKAMTAINNQYSYMPDSDIDYLINILSQKNFNLRTDDYSKLEKIRPNIENFVNKAINKFGTDNDSLCNIYSKLRTNIGFEMEKYKDRLCPKYNNQQQSSHQYGNRGGRGGRGGRGRQ